MDKRDDYDDDDDKDDGNKIKTQPFLLCSQKTARSETESQPQS